MARYDLRAIIRRSQPGMRRKRIVIRDIIPPAVLATDLYRAVFLHAAEVWANALPGIVAEYERSLAAMTTDSAEDIGNQINQAAAQFDRLALLLTPELRRWALRVESWQRGKWRGALLSATGVDVGTLIGPENVRETVGAFVERNTALVRNISAEAQGRISDSVFRGLTNRTPVRDVAKEISEAVGMGRARARRVASDQLSKISVSLAAERRREAGLSVYKYRHSGKKHPRLNHKARDGKLYSDDGADVGKVIDGQTVNAPIPANDRAGIPPWCGCREQGVIDLSD